ncbi:hypothetical protein BJY04DRAFT_167861 [Aspergillus karnatakaensis]|uniref:uncharacterized protein n=1 Tax=Aspergillus karnatakaensis TaxID=1810916 RepID=UPI003CCD0D41
MPIFPSSRFFYSRINTKATRKGLKRLQKVQFKLRPGSIYILPGVILLRARLRRCLLLGSALISRLISLLITIGRAADHQTSTSPQPLSSSLLPCFASASLASSSHLCLFSKNVLML